MPTMMPTATRKRVPSQRSSSQPMPPQASTPATSVPMIDQTISAPRPEGSRSGPDSLMGGRIYHRDPAFFSSVTT